MDDVFLIRVVEMERHFCICVMMMMTRKRRREERAARTAAWCMTPMMQTVTSQSWRSGVHISVYWIRLLQNSL